MILAVLAVPSRLAAAAAPPQYVGVDLGTLGGSYAYVDTPAKMLSSNGVIVGDAGTSTGEDVAYRWQKGAMTGLGTLAGGDFSVAFEQNGHGAIVGDSDFGALDPLTGVPEVHGVIWSGGRITDLGTLGGTQSWVGSINSRGQVAGSAANTVTDPFVGAFCPIPFCPTTQLHAVIWQDGRMQDLGTLGGPDSYGGPIDDSGQVAGASFTSPTPNATTGIPTLEPFIWQNGHMQPLGSLGGTIGFANWMNNVGEVVGSSNLAGDQTSHPFLWNGSKMIDLGTLGGPSGHANWISDNGDVTGSADVTPDGSVHHAFLWRNGAMTDLKPIDGASCSNGFSVNNSGQVAGNITDCRGHSLGAVLWENGSAYDLNSLIAPFPLFLTEPAFINDRGEIVSYAVDATGNPRVALLIPASMAPSLGLANAAESGAAPATSQVTSADRSLPDPRDILGPPRGRRGPPRLIGSRQADTLRAQHLHPEGVPLPVSIRGTE
jgi:probable HAF family extracellular repeat protein